MNYIEHIEFYDNISRFREHSHMSAEVIFVVEGNVTITVQSCNYLIQKGEVCLIPAGIPHSTQENSQSYKRWLMFLNPWLFSINYSSVELQGIISGVTYKKPLIMDLHNGENIFREIHNEILNPQPFGNDVLTANVLFLLSQLLRRHITGEQPRISDKLKTVMAVQVFLQENCHLPVKISDTATKFFTNKFYLTHIFKEHTGMSPKQFLINCRLVKAQQLLTNSRYNISEISEQCGFVSPSDMTKRFREEFGVTPREYRK